MGKPKSSLLELIKCRWREFCREPSALFFVVFMPILWMAILGFAFSGDRQERHGVGWQIPSDGAGGELKEQIRVALAADARVRLKEGQPEELELWLKRGEVQLVLAYAEGSAHYLYDPANRESAATRQVVNDIVQKAAGRRDPVLVYDERVTLPGTRYIDFLVPGLLAMSIMTSSLFGTGMTVVSNRRENLLKRYLATPMRPYEYIVSHIVGRGFILVVELGTILLAGYLMYRFGVAGRLLEFVAFAALGTAAFTALALLCGCRTSSVATMNGMTNLISLPMVMMAGVFFSRSSFPDWIAGPARLLPLTPLVDGLRRIALEGVGIAGLGFEVAVLGAYLVVCTVAAKVLFKWY